jgi:hypothetical protein
MTSGFKQVKWIERIAQSAFRKHPGGWRSRGSRDTVPDCAATRQFWGVSAWSEIEEKDFRSAQQTQRAGSKLSYRLLELIGCLTCSQPRPYFRWRRR